MLRVNNFIGFGARPAAGSAGGKSVNWQTSATSGASGSSYTFSSQALGSAASDRYVIVSVGLGANSATVSSMTIGGVSATSVVAASGGHHNASMWIANVPTGTTGDVVLTLSGSSDRATIGVWASYGLASTTAHDTGSSTARPATDTLTTLAGGFAVGYCCNQDGGTVSWTNATERFDEVQGQVSSGADATTDGSSLSITATQTSTNTNRAAVFATF